MEAQGGKTFYLISYAIIPKMADFNIHNTLKETILFNEYLKFSSTF